MNGKGLRTLWILKMECIRCSNKKVKYDEYTHQYFCKECNAIFTEEDKLVLPFIVVLLLTIVALIPVLNIVLLFIIRKLNIRREYNKGFLSTTLLSNAITLVLVLMFSLNISNLRNNIIELDKTFTTMNETTIGIIESLDNKDYITELPKVEVVEDTEVETETEVIEEVLPHPNDILNHLNNATISGLSIRGIIDVYQDEDFTLIFRTRAMVRKYGRDCKFYIVGNVINGYDAEKKDSYEILINNSQKEKYKGEWILTEDGSYLKESYNLIDDTKKIYHIKNDEFYKLNLIHNYNGDLIGIIVDTIS